MQVLSPWMRSSMSTAPNHGRTPAIGTVNMMPPSERVTALEQMNHAIKRFYASAVHIGNHPFVEFTGVMQAYLDACRRAHAAGIDFTECNRHLGVELPMHAFEVDYLNEKLDCIFAGRIVASAETVGSPCKSDLVNNVI
jgi:hypothetical protein